MLIILGAPEGANDDLPYLRKEQALIRDFIGAEKPVLGICLGSQLVARALGARVYRGARREIGFYHDLEAAGPGLFAGFDGPFTAFHWHADTHDLPQGAAVLASSRDYENQAFRCGSAVGVQFHLEADGQMIRAWMDGVPDGYLSQAERARICGAMDDDLYRTGAGLGRFYANFKSEFGL